MVEEILQWLKNISIFLIFMTTVLNLIPEEKREDYARELIRNQDHLRIMHCPGFIDLDCGSGHRINFKALSCLRLEDMEEFYA